jgi:nitrite reductase (NADH) small subunit
MDVSSQRNGAPAKAPEESSAGGAWIDVCGLDDIVPQTGVCALLGRKQVAIFRVAPDDNLYALSNFDPFSKAFVLSRGIVGDKGGVPKVASPVFKQNFDLRTGQCLDDPAVSVPTYPVRLRASRVEVFFSPHEEKSRLS